MPKELTRKELYNLVWKKPVSEIAKEYGLSDRGLGKLCDRQGIPTPPRGYWAKIKVGQKIKKPPLLFPSTNEEKIILNKLEEILTTNSDEVEEESLPDEVQEIIAYERDSANKILIPKRETLQHPIIKEYEQEMKRYKLNISSKTNKRRNRILGHFLYALEARGYSIRYEGSLRKIKVEYRFEHVHFEISEYHRRYKRKLSEKEQKNRLSKRDWVYDTEKTNKLELIIYSEYGSVIQTFRENEESPLENMLNEAVIEITKEILKKRAYRLLEAEKARIRYEREEEIRKENKRREQFIQETQNWKLAEDIRNYVTATDMAVKNGKTPKENIADWKIWALAFADDMDPLVSN